MAIDMGGGVHPRASSVCAWGTPLLCCVLQDVRTMTWSRVACTVKRTRRSLPLIRWTHAIDSVPLHLVRALAYATPSHMTLPINSATTGPAGPRAMTRSTLPAQSTVCPPPPPTQSTVCPPPPHIHEVAAAAQSTVCPPPPPTHQHNLRCAPPPPPHTSMSPSEGGGGRCRCTECRSTVNPHVSRWFLW